MEQDRTVDSVNFRPVRTVLLDLDGTLVDSATGITEHLSSAMARVGVSWGYAEPDELVNAGAIAVVETPAELEDLLLPGSRCARPPD